MIKRLKLFFALITSFTTVSLSQVGYVSAEDEIYFFLDRMSTNGIIENYNSFELPKTRFAIKNYLTEIVDKQYMLDIIDKNKLEDFLIEFEIDLNNSDCSSKALYDEKSFNYLIGPSEKYLYKFFDDKGTSFFVNFVGKLDYLTNSDIENSSNKNSLLYRFGGEIRGTFFNKIGFEINTTNGSFFGNKDLARKFSSLKYNYKFHRKDKSNSGNDYFDETSAFLMLDYKYATLKIGNDRKLIGHGANKIILSNNAPRMDYLSLDLKYKIFNFSFFHAKLLGNHTVVYDSLQGGRNLVSDKYLTYHRIGLNFSKHLQLGLGEMIIYANRNIDLSYLNPFAFYKSSEHANQDRDNSFLFLDVQNNSFEGIKLYSTLLIDDIDFAKIGTGWYGNKTVISVGTYISKLNSIVPLDFELQYIKIEPYAYGHRISDNNFTNLGYNLSSDLHPNTSSMNFNVIFRPHHRINIISGFTYNVHGTNITDDQGNILRNNGGNILIGHRPFDSKEVYFLKGEREYSRIFKFKTSIEPIKNWIFTLNCSYKNMSLAKSQHLEQFFASFSFCTKF